MQRKRLYLCLLKMFLVAHHKYRNQSLVTDIWNENGGWKFISISRAVRIWKKFFEFFFSFLMLINISLQIFMQRDKPCFIELSMDRKRQNLLFEMTKCIRITDFNSINQEKHRRNVLMLMYWSQIVCLSLAIKIWVFCLENDWFSIRYVLTSCILQ